MTEKNEVRITEKKAETSDAKIAVTLAALMESQHQEAIAQFRKAESMAELEEAYTRAGGVNLGIYLAGMRLLDDDSLDDELCALSEDIDKSLDFEKFIARGCVERNSRTHLCKEEEIPEPKLRKLDEDGCIGKQFCPHFVSVDDDGDEHEGLMIMNSRTREDVGDVPDEDVVITDLVEDGKVIVVDRDDFEDWLEEIMDECEED